MAAPTVKHSYESEPRGEALTPPPLCTAAAPCLDEVQVVWNIIQWDGLSEGPGLLVGDQLLQSLLHELLQRVSGGRVPLPVSQQQLQLYLVILRSPARLQYACRVQQCGRCQFILQQGGSVRSSCGSSRPAGHKWKAWVALHEVCMAWAVRQCLLRHKPAHSSGMAACFCHAASPPAMRSAASLGTRSVWPAPHACHSKA